MNWDYFWIVIGGIVFTVSGAVVFNMLQWLWWLGAIVGLVVYLLILVGMVSEVFSIFD